MLQLYDNEHASLPCLEKPQDIPRNESNTVLTQVPKIYLSRDYRCQKNSEKKKKKTNFMQMTPILFEKTPEYADDQKDYTTSKFFSTL